MLYIYRLIYNFSKVVHAKKGGKFILDRYRIINQICAHEHGTVWLAEHRSLHTKRIIKGIRRSGPAYDMLVTEAATLMKLSHPAIPAIFDMDEDEEFTYLIEEFIEGETLKAFYLKRLVGEEQLLDHLEQVCSVLEYLQDRSVRLIHLDLKPENIMISDRVRIIDLGTAQSEGERSPFRFITAGYTSPEHIRGERTGRESDVYSLGKLISFMTEHSDVNKRLRKRLEQIAKRCAGEEQRNRVGSVVIVTKMLRGATERKHRTEKHAVARANARRIAVIGLARGCGTTHVAVSLASFLSKSEPVVFVQKKRDEVLEELFERGRRGRAGKGIFYTSFEHVGELSLCAAEAASSLSGGPISRDREAVIVADLGGEPVRVFKEAVSRFDLVLIVGAAASWRQSDYDFLERMMREKLFGAGCRVIVNMAGRKAADLLPCGTEAFRFPYGEDPFSPGSETRKLFGKIVGGS